MKISLLAIKVISPPLLINLGGLVEKSAPEVSRMLGVIILPRESITTSPPPVGLTAAIRALTVISPDKAGFG